MVFGFLLYEHMVYTGKKFPLCIYIHMGMNTYMLGNGNLFCSVGMVVAIDGIV